MPENKYSLTAIVLILLMAVSVLNPYTAGDVLLFLIIAFIVLYKMFGDYTILLLLALRPTIDYWRDYVLFNYENYHFNINAALSVLLLIWSVYFLIQHRDYFIRLPYRWAWIIFIIWCGSSAVYSYDLASTITETIKAANLFSLFAVAYILYLRDGHRFTRWFKIALIGGAVPVFAIAIWQFFTQSGMSIDGYTNRIYGTFAHPNILATYALLLFMFWFNEALIKKTKFWQEEKWLSYLTAGFLIAMIFLTYTRIAWIGLAVFLVCAGWVYYRRAVLYIVIGIALFYALFYPVNSFLISNADINLQNISLISRLTSRNQEADSISWRADIFNKVLPLFYRHPFIGYGYGSFAKVWDDNKGVENIWDNTSEAHNDYLKVGFEGGVIGLTLFMIIFLRMIWQQVKFGRKHGWKNLAFLTMIFVYLILSLSDNMLHHTPMIWWLWAVWGYLEAENEEHRLARLD